MLPPVDLNIQLLKKISRGWNLILDPRSKTERNGTSWHKWSSSSISSSKICVKTWYLAGFWSWVQHCIFSCRMSVFFIVAGAAKIANLCQRFNVVTLNQRWFWRCPIWEWQSSPCPLAIGHGLPAPPADFGDSTGATAIFFYQIRVRFLFIHHDIPLYMDIYGPFFWGNPTVWWALPRLEGRAERLVLLQSGDGGHQKDRTVIGKLQAQNIRKLHIFWIFLGVTIYIYVYLCTVSYLSS